MCLTPEQEKREADLIAQEEELRACERASDEFLAKLLADAEDIKLAAMD